jgi:hypothetical protein
MRSATFLTSTASTQLDGYGVSPPGRAITAGHSRVIPYQLGRGPATTRLRRCAWPRRCAAYPRLRGRSRACGTSPPSPNRYCCSATYITPRDQPRNVKPRLPYKTARTRAGRLLRSHSPTATPWLTPRPGPTGPNNDCLTAPRRTYQAAGAYDDGRTSPRRIVARPRGNDCPAELRRAMTNDGVPTLAALPLRTAHRPRRAIPFLDCQVWPYPHCYVQDRAYHHCRHCQTDSPLQH